MLYVIEQIETEDLKNKLEKLLTSYMLHLIPYFFLYNFDNTFNIDKM